MKHLIPVVLFATKLFAFEVGDVVPCVVLDGLTSQGEAVTRCIRDRENATQNYTIVDFALTTCEDCNKSMFVIDWMAENTVEQATTRVVFGDESRETVTQYLATLTNPVNFSVAYDTAKKAMKAWKVSVLPATFVINKKNVVVYKHEGLVNEQTKLEIEKAVGRTDF